jgi:hypothetical protein
MAILDLDLLGIAALARLAGERKYHLRKLSSATLCSIIYQLYLIVVTVIMVIIIKTTHEFGIISE